MNREPVSISTLMTPVRTPTATNAPLHADSPAAIGDRDDFDPSAPDVRTTRFPAQWGGAAAARRDCARAEPVHPASGGVQVHAPHPGHLGRSQPAPHSRMPSRYNWNAAMYIRWL